MTPLPFLALCALTGHLLAQRDHTRALHAALAQAHRQSEGRLRALKVASAYVTRLRSDLDAAQRSEQLARQELTTTRANLKVTEQALVETSAHNQVLLQSRPKPAPKPGQGGFLGWDALGVAMPKREGFSFHDVLTFRPDVATPLDREGGEQA